MTSTAPSLLAALIRSETTKLLSARATWILILVATLGTWPMAWLNAASAVDIPSDDPRLYSSEPIPIQAQGFEMAGLGYVLVVAIAALWAGSEYGSGRQLRTTLLATPSRVRVFVVKAALLAIVVAAVAFVTMWVTIAITHAAGRTGVDPMTLSPPIWANVGGVTLAWTLTALIAFAVGVIGRGAVLPLLLVTPLVIGVGDLLVGLWDGARYLPVAAGASLVSASIDDPLDPLIGGIVQGAWALSLLVAAGVAFSRRDP